MAKKAVLFFSIILFFFFISIAVQARDAAGVSPNEVIKSADGLKNIETLPGAEEIGLIASTIKSAAKTYQSVKSQVASAIGYCQKIIQSLKEFLEKIKSGGFKIKKYIEDKINFISKKYEINSPLT